MGGWMKIHHSRVTASASGMQILTAAVEDSSIITWMKIHHSRGTASASGMQILLDLGCRVNWERTPQPHPDGVELSIITCMKIENPPPTRARSRARCSPRPRSIRSDSVNGRGSSTTWMKSTTRAGRHPGSVSGRGIDYLWDEPHHSRWTASAGGGGCMDPCCLRWMSWERRQLEALIRKLQKIVSTPTHVTQSPTDELVRIGIRSTAHHRIPKFVMPRTTKKPVRNSRSAVPSQTPSKRGRPINAAKQSTRPSRSSASSHTATKRPPSRRLINASMPRRGPNFKWTFRGQIPLISRLPQELLDHIIHIDISKYKNDWLALIIRRVMLSLVCSHWAKTIDGTPHYWDTLAVYPFMNERFINHCVTRMKSSPLTIRVVLASVDQCGTACGFIEPPSIPLDEFIAVRLPLLEAVLRRTGNLYVETKRTSDALALMRGVVQLGLPIATNVSISSSWLSPLKAVGREIEIPNLTTLVLNVGHPLSFSGNFSRVTTLKFKSFCHTLAFDAKYLMAALGEANALEVLEFEEFRCKGVAGEATMPVLNAVTHFKITYLADACAEVAGLFRLPSLVHLTVTTLLWASIMPLFHAAPDLFRTAERVILCCEDLNIIEMGSVVLPMKRAKSIDLHRCTFSTVETLKELVLIPEFRTIPLRFLRLPLDDYVSEDTLRAALSVLSQDCTLITSDNDSHLRWIHEKSRLRSTGYLDWEEPHCRWPETTGGRIFLGGITEYGRSCWNGGLGT
ncbi:hypothetical protein C8R43DRAFT_943196 [Mycena crocata]|nr:hypothetical protein C8R43DRAFT_943196 [Mycena crocata]